MKLLKKIYNMLKINALTLIEIHYKKKFKEYGKGITWGKKWRPVIDKNIKIINHRNISLGEQVHFDEFVHLICADKAEIKIGNNVRFANGFQHLGSSNGIEIGNDVLIAAFVHINDGNHQYKNIKIPIMRQGSYSKGRIKIGNNVWIGHSAHILGGVEIGNNVVIGAGAVVTKNISSNSIAVGNPARIIKKYDENLEKWVKA